METIKIWNDSPSDQQLDRIADTLRAGGIVIVPTDTLYGVACDALNPKAIERICRIKGINPDKATLSIICDDISMAAEYARIDNETFQTLRDNTPGPFTFVLKSLSSLPKAFKQRKAVGIRIPDNATVRAITRSLGNPLMTTSIEFQDPDYAREPELIAETYEGEADLMVDGGDGGETPSTIVDCTGREMEVTRQGLGELQ